MNTLFDDCFALRSAVNAGRIPAKSQTFAQSLLSQFARKGSLSDKQVYWVKKLVADNPPVFWGGIPAAAPQVVADPPAQPVLDPVSLNVKGIRALFDKASAKLKRPAIVLKADQTLIRLYVAGSQSKIPGSVVVTSKHSKRYIGRIDLSGNYLPSPAYPQSAAILDTLKALSDDPAGTAAAHGAATGACCFCNTALTDPKSVGVGYGPICAGHYGLPWGAKKGFLVCS